MRPSPLFLALALGCATSEPTSNGTPPPTDGTPGPGSSTDPSIPTTTDGSGTPSTTAAYGRPTVLEATCTQQANPLRFTCDVTVEPPQPVEVTFVRTDGLGSARTHTSEAEVGTHSVPLYFLGPDRDYTVSVSATAWPDDSVQTKIHSGTPPFDVGSSLSIEGTATAPLLGTELPCESDAIAVIYDTATGDLVWYQNLDPSGTLGLLDMIRFTDEKTILGETGATLSEMDLLGNEIAKFPVEGLGGCCGPHHDVFKWNEQYYFIHQYYPELGLTLDALVIYDNQGNELAHWYPDDVLDIPGSASGDYFHTNTIYVDANGDVYLNYLTQETFVKIEGDLASPDFGQPIWIMSPGNQGNIGNDFLVDWSQVGGADTIGFQHNLHLTNDGRLMVLDNTNGRGLVFSVDETNMTATVDASYDTYESSCGPQGTAMDTTTGDVFVACNTEWVREYSGKTHEQIWQAEVNCRNGGGGGFFGGVAPTRWYPLEGW